MTSKQIDEQRHSFLLTIKRSNYSAIGLHINRIYDLFIFERSHDDHIKNVSNQN